MYYNMPPVVREAEGQKCVNTYLRGANLFYDRIVDMNIVIMFLDVVFVNIS